MPEQLETERDADRSPWFHALVGLASGLWVALADFGSSWLWMTSWPDRGWLLVRIVLLFAPVGMLAGLVLAGLVELAGRIRRLDPRLARPRAWAIPWLLLLAPFELPVAYLLFTGGKASRLPLRPFWVVVAFAALWLVSGLTLEIARRLIARARSGRRPRAFAFAVFAGVFFVAAKLNQHVYPNLYEYLHVALSVVGALSVLAAVYVVADARASSVLASVENRRAVWVAGVAVGALFVGNLATFDLHPNVRVALHEPRTPHSRSLMHLVAPTLRTLAQRGMVAGTPRRTSGAYRARPRTAWNGAPLVALGGAHVLLVTVDALRADHLGAYGHRRGLSPNIDAFARESVVFERAYAAAPHSSYSLSSLMTSEYLHEVVELDVPLPTPTLASVLRANGYHTAAFFTMGIFHTEGERLDIYQSDAFGFQRHQHDNPRAEERTDQVLAEIDRVVEDGEPPSLIWAHYFDTHEPYLDTSLGSADVDRYDAEIRNVDRAFARLLREARARLDRPVVVVLTADHGEEFHEHGGVYHGSSLYEEQVHVPLVLHAEGIAPTRVAEPVELVDVAPTVLGLVGVEAASTMRGSDLRPYAMGLSRRTEGAHSAVTHKRMIVDYPYKLIADLRFDLYELYDLAADPAERRNLASSQPEVVRRLREDVYAWLDGIRDNASHARDAWESALDLGRLRDRRAVDPLCQLVVAENAPTAPRVEAARLLGRFADDRSKPALREAMSSHDPLVAAEAAIALGRMFDPVARDMLASLVRAEDPGIRTRAGISLARLGDRSAVESLLETLRTSRDQFEREEAVRWLGRLGDAQAMEELIELLGDLRIRHLTVVALGQLRDSRALPALLDVLTWEHHATIRNNLVRGLGELGDARAIPNLLEIAWTEPELDYASESLVRARALQRGAIGGIDFDSRTGRRLRALSGCTDAAPDYEWLYVGKTFCRLDGSSLAFGLRTPEGVVRSDGRVLVLFRARATEPRGSAVDLRVGDVDLGRIDLDTTMREHRFEVPASALRAGTTPAHVDVLDDGAHVEFDHVLLLPHLATGAGG